MEKPSPAEGWGNLAAVPRNMARRLFVIFENRLHLLLLELEEERERILLALWLSMAAAVLGLLAALTVTALIVIALWNYSHVIALAILAALYLGGVFICLASLGRLLRSWQTLPGTLDQLRKDRDCLEKPQS